MGPLRASKPGRGWAGARQTTPRPADREDGSRYARPSSWKDRFIASYDVELQDFINAAAQGTAAGPSPWDGYAAAISADACVEAQGKPGTIVSISMPERPALYA